MKKFFAMTAIALAITGCDSSDDDKKENSLGQITISGTAAAGQTLTATVSDDNGIDGTITYTWMVDGTAVAGETSSTFTLTNDHSGKDVSASASYTDNDEFAETVNSSAVTIANDTATVAGDLSGEIAHDATTPLTGTATVSDTDGADEFEPVTDEQATYGTFSITAAGVWTYTLDTSNQTVAGLIGSDLTDSIFVNAADGSPATITITIKGGAATNNVAEISDSTDDGDAGEIRFKVKDDNGDATNYLTGKLTVSFMKEDTNPSKDAYITLFGGSTSTSKALIDLRIRSEQFEIRDNDDVDIAETFTYGEWNDVEFTWDASSASDTVAPKLTLKINGVAVTTDAFDSVSSDLSEVKDGVQTVVLKLGDNSGVIQSGAFYVDDLKIYSDVAGTTLKYEEDFEQYNDNDDLASVSGTPYESDTAKAVVKTLSLDGGNGGSGNGNGNLADGDVAPGTAGNKVALIMDEMDDDGGELRYKLSSADPTSMIAKGKLTASFKKSDNASCTVGSAVKDAYISIYNSSTSTYNALVDLRIAGSDYDTDYAIRNKNIDGQKTVDIPTSIAAFTANTWTHVELSWDATNATADTGPLISVSIDGTQVAAPWNSYSESLADVITGASTFAFKLGDTSANMPDCKFYVDNIKVYSDDDATDTLIYAENFESYNDGDDLDASPFHGNTADAEVDVE